MEFKRWITAKWSNNVELIKATLHNEVVGVIKPNSLGRLIPAKHKYRGLGIPMAIGTGFPDFICFKDVMGDIEIGWSPSNGKVSFPLYQVIGVEVKSNGYLTKEEKEKCKWLVENHIFSKILIASKGTKRGEIKYNEFK